MILKAQMQTVRTRQMTMVRLWPVRATNYGRWCRWWLQSNRMWEDMSFNHSACKTVPNLLKAIYLTYIRKIVVESYSSQI